MRQIAPQLWLGNADDLRNPRALFNAGIRAVVDVAWDEPVANLPRDFIYCRFPLIDGGGNEPLILWQAVRTVMDLMRSELPIIVGCSAGMSRSPTIAAHAMAIAEGVSPQTSLDEIAEQRTLEIHPQLWQETSAASVRLRSC